MRRELAAIPPSQAWVYEVFIRCSCNFSLRFVCLALASLFIEIHAKLPHCTSSHAQLRVVNPGVAQILCAPWVI